MFPVSPDVPLEDGEIAMSDESSEASTSSSRSVRGSRAVPVSDYKRLVRLVLPKVKPGSDCSVVKKLCLSLVKSHKLNVSEEDCGRIAASVCSST